MRLICRLPTDTTSRLLNLVEKIRCCSNCGMGWYNVQTSVVPFNFGPAYEDFEETNDDGQIADYKFEDLNRDIDIMKHIGSLKSDTVYPDEVGFVSYPGASRQGQNSDYPGFHARRQSHQ